MRLALAIIAIAASVAFADGPRFEHKDPILNQEVINIYQDIRNAGGGSSVTIDPLSISSATISSATITSLATISSATITNVTIATATIGNFVKGTIVQMAQGTDTTYTSGSGTTYADTGLSLSFTPKFATSTFLIIISQPVGMTNIAGTVKCRLLRDATEVISGLYHYLNNPDTDTESNRAITLTTDSTGSTSTVTYKTQCGNRVGTWTWFSDGDGSLPDRSVIIVIEVKA